MHSSLAYSNPRHKLGLILVDVNRSFFDPDGPFYYPEADKTLIAIGELPGEVVIPKRRFSAFFATDLALLLQEQGVERLIVAGVKTNVCIRATVQDAFANGLRPTIARGSVSSNRSHLHAASLEDIERYIGEVIDLDTAVDWLRTDGPHD